MTSERGLPARHGVERAAARIHQIVKPRESWQDLNDGAQNFYRAAVAHMLRDLGPAPSVIMDMPLIWYSPSWGVLQAEREAFMNGNRSAVSIAHEIVIALPEDAYPLTPLQPCRPGRSIDDMRRTTAHLRRAA